MQMKEKKQALVRSNDKGRVAAKRKGRRQGERWKSKKSSFSKRYIEKRNTSESRKAKKTEARKAEPRHL